MRGNQYCISPMLAMVPMKQCSKSKPGSVELSVACMVCDNMTFKFRFYETLEEPNVCFSCTETTYDVA